ncbi:tRNA (uridine(54)-C5)-methyltransferase TrmA, partial [Campylobacter curvus]
YYTMHGSRSKFIKISECLKVDESIAALMPRLLEELGASNELKSKIFGVEFISASELCAVVLLYHKRLDGLEVAFSELAKRLGVKIIARSRGQKISSDERELCDSFEINGLRYALNFGDSAFIQPNKGVNEKMISWAMNAVQNAEDMLEMYCGHGNFTIPLAGKFRRVLATEISKSSITNALKNCEQNGIGNIKFLRMSAEELMSAFGGEREFRRLEGVNLADFAFSHVLVDPPRAGLETSVINFIKNYENIIYISCNPQTLYENLKELSLTHKATKFAMFDQFANTNHIECGVVLKKDECR